MLKAIIIEDETISQKLLQTTLETYFKNIVTVVGTSKTFADAIEKIQTLNPDIVFYDLHLPDSDVIGIVESFPIRNFEIIITTADASKAPEAFAMKAIDYIVKPISKQTIESALLKAIAKKSSQNFGSKKIKLPTAHGTLFLEPSQVGFCEADVNYTNIYLTDGTKSVILKPMKEVEAVLVPYGFYRVQKSYIINLNKIKEYSKSGGGFVTVHGPNNTKIPVSKQEKENFENILAAL
jgi:two-component system LytT family response regulator